MTRVEVVHMILLERHKRARAELLDIERELYVFETKNEKELKEHD